MFSVVVKEGTNTLFFYIFEYGAEYGDKYSAESGQFFFQNEGGI